VSAFNNDILFQLCFRNPTDACGSTIIHILYFLTLPISLFRFNQIEERERRTLDWIHLAQHNFSYPLFFHFAIKLLLPRPNIIMSTFLFHSIEEKGERVELLTLHQHTLVSITNHTTLYWSRPVCNTYHKYTYALLLPLVQLLLTRVREWERERAHLVRVWVILIIGQRLSVFLFPSWLSASAKYHTHNAESLIRENEGRDGEKEAREFGRTISHFSIVFF